MEMQRILHNSTAYREMIALRLSVLLQPIGIGIEFINEEQESADILIGAFESGLLIGCCILTTISIEKVQLRQMAVRREWQGKGLGAALLLFAEARASEHGYKQLVLHARDGVMPFYAKHSYTMVEPGFTEVGLPHHVMTKNLAQKA
jgi:GNAT superfamily N-acetyltransferase